MEDSGEIRDIAISKLSKLKTDNYSTTQLLNYSTIQLFYYSTKKLNTDN